MAYMFDSAGADRAQVQGNAGGVVRLVDDNVATSRAVGFFLESLGYGVRIWNNPEDFLREYKDDPSGGCILLDVRMPQMSGLELLERLVADGNALPVVFLTGHGDVEMAVYALKHGAMDFLLKPPNEEKLTEVVAEAVRAGRNQAATRLEAKAALANFAELTDRERDVLGLVAQGLMNKQVAGRLGISEKTVKQHRGSACHKLGLRNAVEIAEFFRVHQLPVDVRKE